MGAKEAVENAQQSFLAVKNRVTKDYHQLKEVTLCNDQVESWIKEIESNVESLDGDKESVADLADKKVHLEKLKEIQIEVNDWKLKLPKIQRFGHIFEKTIDNFDTIVSLLDQKICEQMASVQRHEELNTLMDNYSAWTTAKRNQMQSLTQGTADQESWRSFLTELSTQRKKMEEDLNAMCSLVCQESSSDCTAKIKCAIADLLSVTDEIAKEAEGRTFEVVSATDEGSQIPHGCDADETPEAGSDLYEDVTTEDENRDIENNHKEIEDHANTEETPKEHQDDLSAEEEEKKLCGKDLVITWLSENQDPGFDSKGHKGVQTLLDHRDHLITTLSTGQALFDDLLPDDTKSHTHEYGNVVANLNYDLEAVDEIIPLCQDLESISGKVEAIDMDRDQLKLVLDEVTDKKFELADLEKSVDSFVQVACDLANAILVDVNVKIQEAVINEGRAEGQRLQRLRDTEAKYLALAFDDDSGGGEQSSTIDTIDFELEQCDDTERWRNLQSIRDIVFPRSGSASRKQSVASSTDKSTDTLPVSSLQDRTEEKREDMVYEESLCSLEACQQTLSELKASVEPEEDKELIQVYKNLVDCLGNTRMLKINLAGMEQFLLLLSENDDKYECLVDMRSSLENEVEQWEIQLQAKMINCEKIREQVDELQKELAEVHFVRFFFRNRALLVVRMVA